MIKAALPLSHHFYQNPEAAGKLAESADVLQIKKLPEPTGLVWKKEKIFHWGWGPAQSAFKKCFAKEGLGPYLAENDIGLFSFDLGPAAAANEGLLPLGPTLSESQILKKSARNIGLVRKYFQGPLAAENYNYYPTGLYEKICRPGFIRRYLDELGLYLVLDLAHAAISAHNLKTDFRQYLSELPLEKVREIHLSRPFLPKDPKRLAADCHGPPGEREFGWLDFVLNEKRTPDGVMVAVEYYGNLKSLKDAYQRLSRIKSAAWPSA